PAVRGGRRLPTTTGKDRPGQAGRAATWQAVRLPRRNPASTLSLRHELRPATGRGPWQAVQPPGSEPGPASPFVTGRRAPGPAAAWRGSRRPLRKHQPGSHLRGEKLPPTRPPDLAGNFRPP